MHPTSSCSAALTSTSRSRAGRCARPRWADTTGANRMENDGPSGIVQVMLLTCATPAGDKSPGCMPRPVLARAALHKRFFCTSMSFAQAFPLHKCFLCTGVSSAQVFPCPHPPVFLHLSLSFQLWSQMPEGVWCQVPSPHFTKARTSRSARDTQEVGLGGRIWT